MAYCDQIVHHVLPDSFRKIKSFLSPGVHELLCHCGISNDTIDILAPKGTLDWKCFDEILLFKSDDSEFKNCISKLAPGLTYIQKKYQEMSISEFQNISKSFLKWTKNEKLFFRSFELLHDISSDSQILACLLLTASVERALGDIFLLKGKHVPYLLKDLLATTELKEILGSNMLEVLNMFLGSPLFLNIRNLLWHGFVSPSEINNRYGYFLIVLAMTIGVELNIQNIPCDSIPNRPFITFKKSSGIQYIFSDVHDDDICKILFICLQSPLIFNHMASCFKTVIANYESKRYGESLVLFIPLLESCLRTIFTYVNNCPHRMLTAEASARYVTFTEIFSEYLEDGSKNLLSTVVTTNEMELLYDVFVHPEGPRVRDKLSHGEMNFFSIPQYLVKHLFCIFTVICVKFMRQDVETYDLYFSKLCKSVICYQPLYHPSSFLKRKIQEFISSLKNWDSCPIYELEFVNANMHSEDKNELCILSTLKVYNLDLPYRWCSFSDGLAEFLNYTIKLRILTIYRSKIEGEVTSILLRIVHHAISISENIQHSLRIYYSLLQDKVLRSRQRTTYYRLLKSIHIFYGGLRLILVWLICYASCLNKTSYWTSNEKNVSTRFLNTVLKYCENIDSMSQTKTNKYQDVSFMCSLLLDKSEHHCKFLNKNG